MAENRVTVHRGRINGNAKHNDRDFDVSKAPHIDPKRIKDNGINTWNGSKSAEQAEKEFYEQYFSKVVDIRNAKRIKQGHKEQCKTTEDLRSSKQSMPEETIFQFGSTRNKPTEAEQEKMRDAMEEFIKWHRKQYPQIMIMSTVMHNDEAMQHFHMRQCYVATEYDENGEKYWIPNQEKALEQMGIELPDPSKPRGRYNNRKQTYTKECREKFLEICKLKGLEVIEEPEKKAPTEHNLKKNDMIIAKQSEDIEKLQMKIASLQEEIESLKDSKAVRQVEIEQLQIDLGHYMSQVTNKAISAINKASDRKELQLEKEHSIKEISDYKQDITDTHNNDFDFER